MMKRGEWTMLVIPAIASENVTYRIGPSQGDVYERKEGEVLLPDREPLAVLEATQRELGSMNFAAQYLQNPIPPGGNIIHREWLVFYEKDAEPKEFEFLLASWDVASSIEVNSSYSVGTLWGRVDEDFYLLELVRDKLETPELRKLIIEWDQIHKPNYTFIEGPGLGKSLAQDLRRTSDIDVKLYNPKFDKATRLLTHASRFESRRVHLPRDAGWLRVYVDELLAAPYGKYWDQVDSTTQALQVMLNDVTRSRPLARRNLVRRQSVRRYSERQ